MKLLSSFAIGLSLLLPGLLSGCGAAADPPRPPIKSWSVVVDVDATISTGFSLLEPARHIIASSLLALAKTDHPAISLYVYRISQASYRPDDFVFAATIPAHRIVPLPPKPSRSWGEEKSVYDRALRDWHRAVESLTRVSREAKTTAQQLARQIATVGIPTNAHGTDLTGAVARAGELLSAAPGRRLLVVLSDLQGFGKQYPGKPILNGVEVRVIFMCGLQPFESPEVCSRYRSSFKSRVLRAGAREFAWQPFTKWWMVSDPFANKWANG